MCLHLFVLSFFFFFFFNDTATTEIYTLSLHDALPILRLRRRTTWTPVPDPVGCLHPATRTRFPLRVWRTRSPKRATAPGVRRLPADPPAAPDRPAKNPAGTRTTRCA